MTSGEDDVRGFILNPKAVSIGTLVVQVGVIVTLLRLHSLFGTTAPVVAVQIAAVLLMVWARLTFGLRSFHAAANPTKGGLVTTGPYRLFRHPIYAAIFYFLVAALVSHPSILNAVLVAVALITLIVRIRVEESLLVQQYPEYVSYAARTKRLIPFVY